MVKKQNLKANNPSQQQLNSLLEYYKNGRFNIAENLAIHITQTFPKHQFAASFRCRIRSNRQKV